MAEPWEWEEADLLELVAQKAEESIELDFKSCPALDFSTPAAREKTKFDLSKDVSAFGNSAGGTLVYGIIEDPKTHTAKKLDDGYDPAEISQAWIGQVITAGIQPRIPNVRVRSVPLATHHPGRVAYVVHVPQSSTAHQASDRRYYKRHNLEAVPMEDYEVRDTMHRSQSPRVSVVVTSNLEESGTWNLTHSADAAYFLPELTFCVRNEPGAAVAEYLQTHVFVPASLEITVGPPRPSRTTVSLPNGGEIEYRYLESIISPGDVPLFADEEKFINRFQLKVSEGWPRRLALPFILWRTRSSNMIPNHGVVMFEQLFAGRWKFWPCALHDLPDDYSAHFAP